MDLIKFPDDITADEKAALSNYKKNGCPGITKLTEVDVFKWFQLYMSGKTYTEIAKITNKKKDLILYIANQSKWHEKRLQHYNDITQHLLDKIQQTQLNSVNTVTDIINSLSKYYGDQFNKYLSTNDKSIIKNIDIKLLAQYYKSMETLDKLVLGGIGSSSPPSSSNPAVNVNIEGDATIKQGDGDTLDITKEGGVSKALSVLAHMKKINEKNKK